ncbi:MAG: hypothetical protein ACTSYI_15515 [Promethearchaeota archaeon]
MSFPFNSAVKYNDTAISWFLHVPSSHVYSFLPLVRPYLETLQYHYLDTPNSYSYHLTPENFDETRKIWRKDEGFMVDDVLSEISDPNFFTPREREKIINFFGEIPTY